MKNQKEIEISHTMVIDQDDDNFLQITVTENYTENPNEFIFVFKKPLLLVLCMHNGQDIRPYINDDFTTYILFNSYNVSKKVVFEA
jgi:hypothetical protein